MVENQVWFYLIWIEYQYLRHDYCRVNLPSGDGANSDSSEYMESGMDSDAEHNPELASLLSN